MIPDASRKEWRDLITGEHRPRLSSFSLQMKINTLATDFKSGKLALQDAIKELHTMCVKYEKIYEGDLKKVFKS